MENITIRTIRQSDIQELLGWMIDEGWVCVNANLLEATVQWDPEGFLVAEDSNGQLIGSIACAAMTEYVASGSFFIVPKAQRGKGVGTKLWEARLKYLDGRNLAVDAVEARVKPNKAKGFVHQTYDVGLYVGRVQREKIGSGVCDDVEFIIYTEDMLPEVVIYDATIHQVERPVFLKQFLKLDITSTLVAKRDGRIIGYGSIQLVVGNGNGKMQNVGPVFADEEKVGRALFNRLFALVPDDHELTMAVPLTTELGQEMVKTHSLNLDLMCTRMYNRKLLHFPMEKVFAKSTLGVSLM